MVVPTVLRLLGLIVGIVAGWYAFRGGSLGTGATLVAPAFAGSVLAGALLAETAIPRPRPGQRHTARLQPRRLRDHVPPRATVGVLVLAATAAVLLTGTGLTGTADDMGRPDRALRIACGYGYQQFSPWPGWWYGRPVLISTSLVLLLAWTALAVVARRPPAPARTDDLTARRRAGRGVVSAAGVAVAVPLAGCAAFAAQCMLSADCAGPAGQATGWILLSIAIASLLAAAWYAAILLLPAPARTPEWPGPAETPEPHGSTGATA